MTTPTSLIVARSLSIVGHPAVVMPVAMFLLIVRFGASVALIVSFAAVLAIAGSLMLWGRARVAHGGWRHIDASSPHERGEWNRTASAVLGIGAIVAAGVHLLTLGLGLGCCVFILLVATGASRRLKLSQHVAFATLSIFIAGFAGLVQMLALSVLTIAVAWSRLRLGRHTTGEIFAGAAIGLLAGLALTLGSLLLR